LINETKTVLLTSINSKGHVEVMETEEVFQHPH
jgi:hypothetical protein